MKSSEKIIELHKKYVMGTYAPGLILVRGEGSRVWDADGKEYLDFLAGIAVLNVGHCHPTVVKAVQEQAAKLMHVSNLYYNEKQPLLAEALSTRSLKGKCFFCNSGAEANEAMIKLARLWGHEQGKYEIITMRNSFHGRTLATLAATGQTKYQKGFQPMPEGFTLADYNDIESCRNAVSGQTAAIMVEAIQGEGGIVPADPEFMQQLRALCDEKDLLLLCDEVQCGLARTGEWFGFQTFGVEPDAFALAKGLGGGFPIGALVTSPRLADTFKPGHHASTFGGTPLACAAALAVIEVVEKENLLRNAVEMAERFMKGLEAIGAKYDFVKGVRGKGLMIGMLIDRPCKPLEVILREKGLITIATADTVIRFLPPLIVKEAEIDRALEIVDAGCAAWQESLVAEG